MKLLKFSLLLPQVIILAVATASVTYSVRVVDLFWWPVRRMYPDLKSMERWVLEPINRTGNYLMGQVGRLSRGMTLTAILASVITVLAVIIGVPLALIIWLILTGQNPFWVAVTLAGAVLLNVPDLVVLGMMVRRMSRRH